MRTLMVLPPAPATVLVMAKPGSGDLVSPDEQRLAVNRESAARLAQLSLRQVDYWAKSALIVPTVDEHLGPGRRVRLYGFVDLLAMMVAATLKERGISLQHIRAVVDHLQRRGYQQPLTEVRWATIGNRIYFQHDDGGWEGDLSPDQTVLSEVLNLDVLRARISTATERPGGTAGQIEKRRGVRAGKAVVAGTRVPVDTVRRYLAAGRTVEEIIESFPVLTATDVDAVRAETVA
ncbi:DUF433 domain-containing protein [Cryptosporangium sp. NPDC048952]|uniref:DUF433 domain-containing protein n=1 Tax=Cryptosporangium sp. NPDC048952 TaxID=3363961 RepID=UPI00371D1C06